MKEDVNYSGLSLVSFAALWAILLVTKVRLNCLPTSRCAKWHLRWPLSYSEYGWALMLYWFLHQITWRLSKVIACTDRCRLHLALETYLLTEGYRFLGYVNITPVSRGSLLPSPYRPYTHKSFRRRGCVVFCKHYVNESKLNGYTVNVTRRRSKKIVCSGSKSFKTQLFFINYVGTVYVLVVQSFLNRITYVFPFHVFWSHLNGNEGSAFVGYTIKHSEMHWKWSTTYSIFLLIPLVCALFRLQCWKYCRICSTGVNDLCSGTYT